MIIKTDKLTYLNSVKYKDKISYTKLPVVTSNNTILMEDMVRYYLGGENLNLDKIAVPHITSVLCLKEECELDNTENRIYVEFYDSATEVVKLSLASIIEKAKFAKGAILKSYLNSTAFLRNMKKDFNKEVIEDAINRLYEAIESLSEFDCMNVIETINMLCREDFNTIVYLLVGELQTCYRLEKASVMEFSDLKENLNNNLYYKYFIKQIRLDVPNQDVNYCFGSINETSTVLPYFNIKGIVGDSALIPRKLDLYEALAVDLRKLGDYLPITSKISLEAAINAVVTDRTISVFQQKIFYKLILGELIKACMTITEFKGEDIYNEVVQKCITNL